MTGTEMTDDDVAEYLRINPEFFEQQTELLAQITLYSPHGNSAVSLGERQMTVLRDKLRQLEGKLAELIRFGEENDAIAEKVHQLAVALIGATDFAATIRILYSDLGGSFAVPHVALRLWGGAYTPRGQVSALSPSPSAGEELTDQSEVCELSSVSERIKSLAANLSYPYCGPSAGQESVAWFGDRAGHIRSMAQIPLRSGNDCFGLLVLASEEGGRFYPNMGVLYLSRIGDMAAAVLERVAGST